jgi:3-dehydroquinate dehydratase-2
VLVDKLHEGIDLLDGRCSIRPAHAARVALHDAIKAMPFPVLEIHMTNIAAREVWRDASIVSPAVKATIQGLGWRSYIVGCGRSSISCARPRVCRHSTGCRPRAR